MSFQTEHNLFTFKMQGMNFSANLKEFGLKTKKKLLAAEQPGQGMG